MPRPPKRCKLCGQPPRDGEALSHRGYHIGCGMRRAEDAARQMAARSGEAWDRWLESNGPLGLNRYSEGGSPLPAGREGVQMR